MDNQQYKKRKAKLINDLLKRGHSPAKVLKAGMETNALRQLSIMLYGKNARKKV